MRKLIWKSVDIFIIMLFGLHQIMIWKSFKFWEKISRNAETVYKIFMAMINVPNYIAMMAS